MKVKLSPKEEYELKFILAEVYFYADLLERKITEINPIRRFNDTTSVLKFESARKRATELREHLDKALEGNAEKWGDTADDIEKIINTFLKDIEKKELAEQNNIKK